MNVVIRADCIGPTDFATMRYIQMKHIGNICNSFRDVQYLLRRLHLAVEEGGGEEIPGSFVIIFNQIETVAVKFLERYHAPFFLRKVLRTFPQFDYLFVGVIEEIKNYEDIAHLCIHRVKYLFLTDLLDHIPVSTAWNLKTLENSIMAEQNREKIFTSKMGGIWIAYRILARRPDLHSEISNWIRVWPKILLSAMTVDCVVVLLFGNGCRRQAHQVSMAHTLCDRKSWIHEFLLGDVRFSNLLTAIWYLGPPFSNKLEKEMDKYIMT
jgi:hypothetical protein